MYFHGLYQVKRGRSRIDELFAIVFSVLIGSSLVLGATLYVRVYHRFQPDVAPLWEYSQAVFALFVLTDVVLLYVGRAALRAWLERRWAAGYNVKRVVVAGAAELGRHVAETIVAHRELGYRVVGFLDDTLTGEVTAGLPVLGRLNDAASVARAHARPDLRGPAPRRPREDRGPHQEPGHRMPGREGRARPRAIRDHPRRPRRPGRHPDHQPQRGPPPRLQQHGEARHGHRRGIRAADPALHGLPHLAGARPRAFACAAARAPSCCARSG